MNSINLADRVEQNPAAALAAFSRLDDAVNLVLPGQDTYHTRYAGVGEVGLATVVARDLSRPDSYNPFDPTTPDRLSFIADNYGAHPGAWAPEELDEKMLGGPVPEWLKGRFVAFGLAKLNLLSGTVGCGLFSHCVDTSNVQPGEFGNAGGQRLGDAFLGVSGLWQIHDHVAGLVFNDQIARAGAIDTKPSTVDTLSGDMESILGDIKLLHRGTKAEELSRKQVADLLLEADTITMKRLQKAN